MPSWKVRSRHAVSIACHHLTFENLKFVGFSWESLPEGSLVVDVGGGVGAQSLVLATHRPQLRLVVQDRESVMSDGIDVCAIK